MNRDMSFILVHVGKYECAGSKSMRQEDRDGVSRRMAVPPSHRQNLQPAPQQSPCGYGLIDFRRSFEESDKHAFIHSHLK